ncbi:hypothetical protein ABH15_13410 [Methanoculleus taiwanensis]|uniref:Hemerythrin-like domain-containing protein n=1 Tax=Methanoculleus taiwanensis TaxID=1550565 RepID=A0A498GW79_9EURY|nr:hemerythrin domain-containing protein [Methanoculleus taiwanensis]RXE55201.1 hypothetical protein ABH15_13410 [Methanoculleus taiwanensis]
MADIIEMIREDHSLIRRLLDDLERHPDVRDIRYITLKRELQMHMHAEEATIYQRLLIDIPDAIGRSIEEHNRIRLLLGKLDTTPLGNEVWTQHLGELRSSIEDHFDGEEDLLLKRAADILSQVDRYEMYEQFQMEKGVMAQYTR